MRDGCLESRRPGNLMEASKKLPRGRSLLLETQIRGIPDVQCRLVKLDVPGGPTMAFIKPHILQLQTLIRTTHAQSSISENSARSKY